MGSAYSIAATKLFPVMAWLRDKGYRDEEVLGRAGLEPRAFDSPDRWLTDDAASRLLAATEELSGDSLAGLRAGLSISKGFSHLTAYVLQNSPSLGYALSRFIELERIVDTTTSTSLGSAGQAAYVAVKVLSPKLGASRHFADYRIAGCVAYARLLTGADFPVSRVDFAHGGRGMARDYRDAFGCEVRFGQAENRVTAAASALDAGVREPNPEMLRLFETRAAAVAATAGSSEGVRYRLGRALCQSMSRGMPGIRRAAAELGMSVRNLQRRLAEEGTSYSETAEGVRKRAAMDLLDDASLSLGEIAFLMGFSEPSAFHRSFKRWTGSTPARYRARGRAGAEAGGVDSLWTGRDSA